MKKVISSLVISATLATSIAFSNTTPDTLTGDTKLACEAILCLSSGKRPEECNPSIKKYFSIKAKKWKDTVKARRDFLKLCPVDDADKKDPVFADLRDNVLPNIDSRKCTAEWINSHPQIKCIQENCGERRCVCIKHQYKPEINLPAGCQALYNHKYTNIRPKNICTQAEIRWYSQSEWNGQRKDCWVNE